MSTPTRKIDWNGQDYHLITVDRVVNGFTYATLGYWGGDYRWHTRTAAMADGEWSEVAA